VTAAEARSTEQQGSAASGRLGVVPASHAAPRVPRGSAALREPGALSQNSLAVRPDVPLHVRPVLNGYAEVVALGICSERALRRHVATGRVKRCVIRNGRNLRFVKDLLIAELLEAGG
jgi:hypothetical protein